MRQWDVNRCRNTYFTSVRLYAAYILITAVNNVHVANVLDDNAVTIKFEK